MASVSDIVNVSCSSKSSILLSRIKFETGNYDDDIATKIQEKYELLAPDPAYRVATGNGVTAASKELIAKLNGQFKNGISCSLNGNHSETTLPATCDDIPVPKTNIASKEQVILQWKQPSKIGAGLYNLGNTCFLNSVIQCLTYCPPLNNYLTNSVDDHSSKCKISGFCMLCELQNHVRRSLQHSGENIKPLCIYQKLRCISKSFQFGRQEDAHEFLRYVVDNMCRACIRNYESTTMSKLDAASKETTIINSIFGGYHRSQVTCFVCKEKSTTYDHFMDFMLDIKNVMSLEKALDNFTKPEVLNQDNAYKCTKCKKRVPANKRFTVHRAPNVATFQFKRFDYNRVFGGKITKHIQYPEKLNLRPYMSNGKGDPIIYNLYGVLVHLGPTCNSGHYFCFVKNSNCQWYLMDDSRVSSVSLNHVLNQQAYILFYSRNNSTDQVTNHKNITTSSVSSQVTKNNGFQCPSIQKSLPTTSKDIGQLILKPTPPHPASVPRSPPPPPSPMTLEIKTMSKPEAQFVKVEPVNGCNSPKQPTTTTSPMMRPHLKMKLSLTQTPPNERIKTPLTKPSWLILPKDQGSKSRETNAFSPKLTDQSNDLEPTVPATQLQQNVSKPKEVEDNHIEKDTEENGIEKTGRKRQKKKKKDKKEKRRKKLKLQTSSNGFSEDEFEWVERTKETVQKEKDSNDVETIKWDECKVNGSTNGNDDGENGTIDTLKELKSMSIRAYGPGVTSWDGGNSRLNESVAEDIRNQEKVTEEDEYNKEYDAGKTKKVKLRKYDHNNDMTYNGKNPFQLAYDNHHRNAKKNGRNSDRKYFKKKKFDVYKSYTNRQFNNGRKKFRLS